MHGAQAQVVPAGTDGYYYSVQGGFALNKSEEFLAGLKDKVGSSSFNGSGYVSSFNGSSYYFSSWSSSGSSFQSGLDDYKGLFASVSFGKQLTDNLDVRGSLSITGAKSSSGFAGAVSAGSSFYASGYNSGNSGHSYSSYYSGFNVAGANGVFSSSLIAADFEVGYTPTLSNNFNVRLFAGLRAMQFTQTFEGFNSAFYHYDSAYSSSAYAASGSGSDLVSGRNGASSGFGYYSFDGKTQATFTGIGPRIGVQGSTRFEGTNFGLSGSLASSVIFGKQTVKTSGYFQSGSSYSFSGTNYSGASGSPFGGSGSSYASGYTNSSYSGNKTVLDLQASVGVDYYLKDNTVLTVGYQGEKVMEVNGDDLGSIAKIDSLSHGAFVKLSGSF
jgi:hypothetical protein